MTTTTFVQAEGGGKETLSVVAASGTAQTVDLADGNTHDITLTDNCTITMAGATAGVSCSVAIYLRQDATGGRTPTFDSTVDFGSSGVPAWSTTAGLFDIVVAITVDGGTSWQAGLFDAGFGS